jgi:hypothetical protein
MMMRASTYLFPSFPYLGSWAAAAAAAAAVEMAKLSLPSVVSPPLKSTPDLSLAGPWAAAAAAAVSF